MTVKIPMRLQGIDLRDSEAYDRIHPDLEELFWMSNGAVSLAVLFSDARPSVAVDNAADLARRIAKLMPGVCVAEVHDELVGISDVAARADVAHEAVRLWATGKRRASIRPFPGPHQVIGTGSGGKTMSLYAWREVLSWIREILGTDPDQGVEYLTDAEHAALNAELAMIREEVTAWHPIAFENEQIITEVRQICQQTRVTAPQARAANSRDADPSADRHQKLPVEFA
jgi:hypothetical protein